MVTLNGKGMRAYAVPVYVGYTVLKTKKSAENYVNSLIKKGHKAFYVEAHPFNDEQIWYRVRVGYFDNLQKARSYKSKNF